MAHSLLYKVLASLAYIIAIEDFFSDSSGTCNKEHDFWAKPSSGFWIPRSHVLWTLIKCALKYSKRFP